MAAAIPFAATAIGGLFGNRKTDAEKQMEALAGQQSQLARTISDIAGKNFSMAQPALAKAMSYYQTLATGNRGAVNGLLAPQYGQVTDYYRGAEKGIESRSPAGPQRERAIAELYRQKAGQLGMMPMQARSDAVGKLGEMGTSLNQSGLQGYGLSAAALNSSGQNLGQLAQMQQGRQQGWVNFGSQLGTMFAPYLFGQMGKSGGLNTKSLNKDFIGGSLFGGQ
jgi:hypothetical protein